MVKMNQFSSLLPLCTLHNNLLLENLEPPEKNSDIPRAIQLTESQRELQKSARASTKTSELKYQGVDSKEDLSRQNKTPNSMRGSQSNLKSKVNLQLNLEGPEFLNKMQNIAAQSQPVSDRKSKAEKLRANYYAKQSKPYINFQK